VSAAAALLARLRDDERGEVEDLPALILLILTVLVPLTAFLFILGQYGNAGSQVQAAAFAAARDASLTGSPVDAQQHAVDAARASLQGNLRCDDMRLALDDSGLDTGLGQTGSVSATVTCTVHFLSIRLPGIPTASTISQTATSPIDPYRERG
jgi:hypothetical protein